MQKFGVITRVLSYIGTCHMKTVPSRKTEQSVRVADNKNWAMEIKTNNRLDPKDGNVNRMDEFIKDCALNGCFVNKIDVQTRVDIHKKVNEDIEFE